MYELSNLKETKITLVSTTTNNTNNTTNHFKPEPTIYGQTPKTPSKYGNLTLCGTNCYIGSKLYIPLTFIVLMTTLLVVVCKKNNINNYFVVGDITLYIVQTVLHVMLILRDPGILPITQDINKPKGNDEVYCNKCNIYAKRSDALYHCAICDICVSHSEYHCAYIGKCVGKNNYAWHKLFIMCAGGYLGLSVLLLVFVQS